MSNRGADTRRNVVLIVVDQWRSDCLGAAGHPAIQTPHLDGLARQGTRFTRAYSSVPSCIAARAALLTGLDQRRHGRVGYRDGVAWTYPQTLGTVFAGAGFHTQAVGKMHVHPARSLCGFHNVVLHDGYLHANRRRQPEQCQEDDYTADLRRRAGADADFTDAGPGCNGYSVAPWPYDAMLHPSAWVTTQAVDFLRRRDPARPFLLKVSYHRPHPPLDPPAGFLDLCRDLAVPPPVRGDWLDLPGVPTVGRRGPMLDSPIHLGPHGIALARRAYYAQCTFIDHQVNRLVHALHEHRVWDDTSIVFVSDHGEMLFDHDQVGKAQPWEASAGVPFLVRPAESLKAGGSRTSDALVELRDVLPTLCDLAGIPAPAGLDGRSVLPFCRGATPASWRAHLHGEHAAGSASNHWIVRGPWKYAWYSQTGAELLFNLADDPQECTNLAAVRQDEAAEMRRLLIEALRGREEGYVDGDALVPGRPPQAVLRDAGLQP
jgi:arylsulfatase A-like enzyme